MCFHFAGNKLFKSLIFSCVTDPCNRTIATDKDPAEEWAGEANVPHLEVQSIREQRRIFIEKKQGIVENENI